MVAGTSEADLVRCERNAKILNYINQSSNLLMLPRSFSDKWAQRFFFYFLCGFEKPNHKTLLNEHRSRKKEVVIHI